MYNYNMSKKYLILGGAFGIIAPFIGIFLGLQVSVALGNILAFPVIGLAYLTGHPFGMWHPLMMVLAIVLSVFVWALIFGFVAKLIKKD